MGDKKMSVELGMWRLSRRCAGLGAACCAVFLSCFALPAVAEYPITQQSTLMDRIQIEDLLENYMWALDSSNPEDFAANFTDDAIFDLNGITYKGKAAIQGWVAKVRAMRDSGAFRGAFHMLLNNWKIVINGNTAIVKGVWTGTVSDRVQSVPRFVEQGHYDDEVFKKNGRWHFSKRLVTSDGGMAPEYDKTYAPR
jgi:hypothetical protein